MATLLRILKERLPEMVDYPEVLIVAWSLEEVLTPSGLVTDYVANKKELAEEFRNLIEVYKFKAPAFLVTITNLI